MAESILQLQGQNASFDKWKSYIVNAMQSALFKNAIDKGLTVESAASIVLLDDYFSSVSKEVKALYLKSIPEFAAATKEFIEKMKPFKYNKNKLHNVDERKRYVLLIRRLLKDVNRDTAIGEDNYHFIRSVVRFTSSADYIMKSYHIYKKFAEDIK